MAWISRIVAFWKRMQNRQRTEQDLDEEIRGYYAIQEERRTANGLTPQEASRRVRLQLGGQEQAKEQVRDARFGSTVEAFVRDVCYACRGLRKSPGFTAITVATLALGIGANTALFSVIHAVLLRPMNYPEPQRIVQVTRSFNHGSLKTPAISAAKFDFWSRQNHSFAATAAYNYLPGGINLTRSSDPIRLTNLPVSAGFFRVLGVPPFLGRSFTESEDRPGAGHFAVVSYALWQRVLQGDPKAVGRNLNLNGVNYNIMGVMPQDFTFPTDADVWTPLQLKVDPEDHSNNYPFIARLKPGVSCDQAAADMTLVGQRFRQQFGRDAMNDGEDIAVMDFHSWTVGDIRPLLLVLMASVGFVLLIACANVANLLLARSAVRQREIAVRAALGASASRLISSVLAESLVLSVAGGVLGVLMARLALPLLLRLAPPNLPLLSRTAMDGSVVFFSAILAVFTGLIFALLPALQVVRFGIGNPLRDAGLRTTGNLSSQRARQTLIVAEVGLSVVLLAGAGLLMQTFRKLSGVEPGFDTRNVLTMQMSLSGDQFRTTAPTALLTRRIVTRLEAMPNVVAVASTNALPTVIGPDMVFEILGRSASKGVFDEALRTITPQYFAALNIPVMAGRAFTTRDTPEASPVIIINQALARKYFPNQNPIGQQILMGRLAGPMYAERPREIVGVVGDTRDSGLNFSPPAILFEPLAQAIDALVNGQNQMTSRKWLIRTATDPLPMAEPIRREALSVSNVPLGDPQSLDQVVGASLARQRFSMTLLVIFAALALLLCSIGLYGVISYSFAQRTRELGVRAALGARRADLLRLVLSQGLKMVSLGLLAGLVAAFGLTRFLQSMLYGVTSSDPLVLISVLILLTAVSMTACYLPARRAASVDPMTALREQ